MLIASCQKPDSTPSTVVTYGTYSSMDTIYKMLEVKPKYVIVNGATGGTFYGSSGTRYIIPPNCLQDASGNSVTTDVQFEVAEYLYKGDMVFSKMLPLSDGQALISGGEISMNASLGGAKIYLKPGCLCTANVPQPGVAPSGMSIFSGLPATDPTESVVNWQRFDSIPGRIAAIIRDTTKIGRDTLTIVTDSLKWMNLDKFASFPDIQKFDITLSATGNSINTPADIRCLIFVDTLRCISSLGHYKKTIDHYTDISCAKIPVHIVAFGLINKKFYGAVLGITPATGNTYNLSLSEVDPMDFKGQLNLLVK